MSQIEQVLFLWQHIIFFEAIFSPILLVNDRHFLHFDVCKLLQVTHRLPTTIFGTLKYWANWSLSYMGVAGLFGPLPDGVFTL